MSKLFLYGLLGILLLSGCKKDVIPSDASATTETIGRVSIQNIDFNYLTARGQLKLEDKGETTTSGYALRVKKDSVIWVSVLPGLGIEAARLKITQDSVFIMNRIHKEYTATDFGFLSKRFKVDMNYDVLQAILLGNYQSQGREKVMDSDKIQHIQQLRPNLLFDFFIARDNQKLQQLNVVDQFTGNTVTVRYNNFQAVGQVAFAYEMAAQVIQTGMESTFVLNHNKVTTTNEMISFPFAVPSDYKRL
jgi:hypothetical protein